MLSDEELLRYSRQILLAQVDVEGQLRLKYSHTLVVGPGGLGSSVALYLAATGVGGLHLAGLDVVDPTNLQRQAIHDGTNVDIGEVESAMRRLNALDPQIRLVSHSVALDEDSLDAAVTTVDLVLDYTDNLATREAVSVAYVRTGKPLISGAAIRLEGQLSVFDIRHDANPCYHCSYGHGSKARLTYGEAGVTDPLVGLVGSLQVLGALKLLADFGESLVGCLLLMDALGTHFRESRVRRDLSCAIYGQRHDG